MTALVLGGIVVFCSALEVAVKGAARLGDRRFVSGGVLVLGAAGLAWIGVDLWALMGTLP